MFEDIHDPGARVRALCMFGCQVDVDHSIPPKRYFRSGKEMIRMANVYLDEKDYESAFVLYSKYITIFVEKLPKHPEYVTATAADKAENNKKLKTVFPLAETIKKKLTEQYQKDAAKFAAQERLRKEQEALAEKKRREEEERFNAMKEEERQVELRRRQEAEVELRREQERELEYLKEQERLRVEEERRRQINGAPSAPGAISPTAPDISAGVAGVVISTSIPSVPPPSYGQVYPDEVKANTPQIPSRDMKPSAPVTPSVDRTTKPSSHFASTGAATQNLHNFRDVVVPAALVERFLNIARPNTDSNTETCGILSGKVSKNAFTISHLLIPKQSGTPDTCTTESEEDIFVYQDAHSLVTLGWIHTHPTQTAFLSSVDLHTHCSYQQLLPEAIAIVCSPKFNETRYLYLTPQHGLSLISGCRKRGFHEHPQHPPLFEDATHIKVDPVAPIEVVDLRK